LIRRWRRKRFRRNWFTKS